MADVKKIATRESYGNALKELGAEEQQAAQVEAIRAERGIPAAEEAAREWNVIMGLLNEMAHLLGEQTVTVAEYEDLFGLLLRSSPRAPWPGMHPPPPRAGHGHVLPAPGCGGPLRSAPAPQSP